MAVGLYLRVSTQEQAKEGYSIGEQESRLKLYCEAMQWQIYKIYIDPGYSGGDTNRPGLQELIKDVETGCLDRVVVYKLDRLSRSQLDTLYLIEKVFLAHDTDFVSMSENFDTSTPFGRAMIGILAVFAQLEREQIKERMGMGKEARAKEGKWHGSTSPIGYDYNAADDMLYINEYETMQIKELIDLFLQGMPLRTIETLFLKKGYKHKYGVWESKSMKRVLGSKLYIGYIKHRDEHYEGLHEPIISVETFEKVQKLLKQRAIDYQKHGIRKGVQTSYLGGLLFCKHCGGRYCRQAGRKWKNNAPPTYYSCYSRNKSVKKMIKDPNCKNKNWRTDDLDKIIIDEIKKLSLDPKHSIDRIRIEKEAKESSDNRIDILKTEIRKINDQISRFMDLYGIGKFTIDQVSGKVDPLNEQRQKLEDELNSLTASAGQLTDEEIIDVIESFEDVFNRGDFDEIRAMIEILIDRIELDNEDIHIHWKFA